MEDVLCLTHLPLFGEANDMGIVVDEDNKMKLKHLPAVMTSSISSTKSTYATWLKLFCEGDGSYSDFSVGVPCMSAVLVCTFEWTRRWAQSICFPLAIQIAKGVKFVMVPLFFGCFLREAERVCQEYHLSNGEIRYSHVCGRQFPPDIRMERFSVIFPKPMELPAAIIEEATLVECSQKTKITGTHKPWAWRWLHAKPSDSKSLVKVLDEEKNLCFMCDSYIPQGIFILSIFRESNRDV